MKAKDAALSRDSTMDPLDAAFRQRIPSNRFTRVCSGQRHRPSDVCMRLIPDSSGAACALAEAGYGSGRATAEKVAGPSSRQAEDVAVYVSTEFIMVFALLDNVHCSRGPGIETSTADARQTDASPRQPLTT